MDKACALSLKGDKVERDNNLTKSLPVHRGTGYHMAAPWPLLALSLHAQIKA